MYSAWIAVWAYHGTNPDERVYVRDLLTGRSAKADLGDLNGGDACAPPAGSITLLLASTGVAAWQAERCSFSPAVSPQVISQIQALGSTPGATTTLDTAPTGKLANLQLVGCLAGCSPIGSTIAWWTHDGTWRSARVG